MASSGYGKRSAPGESARSAEDFAHLPVREAYLASLIDHLPEGAAMDTKTLAAHQPLYGQQAVRTALNRLSAAGHLRRIRERVGADRTQWVFRTYFSRTSRTDGWWAHFLATGEARAQDAPAEVHPDERPAPEPPCSPAYAALAGLGLADARLSLSAADCAALEPLAAQWLARGTTPDLFTAALVSGLPPSVHSPAGLVRRRLVDKMPPERAWPPAPAAPGRVMECTACRTPGRPTALLGGICRACRTGTATAPPPQARLAPAAVRTHAARIRTTAGWTPAPRTYRSTAIAPVRRANSRTPGSPTGA
ncbi:hypothetical protein ACFVVX_14780 [Kitasatospora sp. NPDC058170]|uniref:hypothetical protein n=1 Tax=Kitasatospora sp. NPDC058170 TaxID=3346364 RepID=UPI0036DD78AA